MPGNLICESRFAFPALRACGFGAIGILLLDIAERNGWIAQLTESTLCLAICSVVFVVLLPLARTLSGLARIGMTAFAVLVLANLSLVVVEDIGLLDSLPLIGHDSRWIHNVGKFIVAGWTCGLFLFIYALLRQLEETRDQSIRDAVQLKLANVKLQTTLAELKKSQQMVVQQERISALGQMASGVAHDLNNALTPVWAFADFLRPIDVPAEQRESLRSMRAGVEHACRVVKQLQYFYRRTERPHCEQVALSALVEQSVQLTRFRWHDDTLRRGLVISVTLELDEDSHIVVEPTELIQVLNNLVLNAVEAMPKGGEIAITVARDVDVVRLTIVDDGEGMTAKQRARCFDPFFTTKRGGSGLGLNVCRTIVERYGGTIAVFEAKGDGTKFALKFPYAAPATAKEEKTEDVRPQHSMLVIDDSEFVRQTMHALLTSLGFAVKLAEDGQSGMDAARESEADLIFVDYAMPGMTGCDVVAGLRELSRNIPVVVMSGWAKMTVLEQFGNSDVQPDQILEKPLNAEAIQDCLTGFGFLAAPGGTPLPNDVKS